MFQADGTMFRKNKQCMESARITEERVGSYIVFSSGIISLLESYLPFLTISQFKFHPYTFGFHLLLNDYPFHHR